MTTLFVCGTRAGGSEPQLNTLQQIISKLAPTHLITGACIGVDEEAVEITVACRAGWGLIVSYPASDVAPHKVSQKALGRSHEICGPMPALNRNKLMAQRGDLAVALPQEGMEITRSGTWTAIRDCRRLYKLCIIIDPTDGSIKLA